jgi:hypothetical protein
MQRLYQRVGNIPLKNIPVSCQTIQGVWRGVRKALDPDWLEGVRAVSRLCPDLRIRTAHLSSHRVKGPHVDGVPGINLIWVHLGNGFFVEDEQVIVEPGDVIVFDRSRVHRVSADAAYIRTVVTTIFPGLEKKYPRFLRNGVFYDAFEPLLEI